MADPKPSDVHLSSSDRYRFAMISADSPRARRAHRVVQSLQHRFTAGLQAMGQVGGSSVSFERLSWLRDDGRHGGGDRAQVSQSENRTLDRGSINVSQVHYDDRPDRALSSATALSAIVHPRHPRWPSMHTHISYTEMRDGLAYWRLMADLNPALPSAPDTATFSAALQGAEPHDRYVEAVRQGDQYFYIPACGRHRGAMHFYLEGYRTECFDADVEFAERVGAAGIDAYLSILRGRAQAAEAVQDEDRRAQLAYHTLYFFQVLTLDRGTTSGLLVHDQNDLGILGSLPGRVDPELLASWRSAMPTIQAPLLDAILSVLPKDGPAWINDQQKRELARIVRAHYRQHPHALEAQASADRRPPAAGYHASAAGP